MEKSASEWRIENVRGRMGETRAEQLLGFWAEQVGLDGPAARRRLPQVVCVLLDGDGEVTGVNSASSQEVGLIGGRSFWVYRSFLLDGVEAAWPEMVHAAFEALAAEFEPGIGPVGLFVPVDDHERIARDRAVFWPETGLMYAGYLRGGVQARIRYFEGATV